MNKEWIDMSSCQYEKAENTGIEGAPKASCWWCEYAEKADVAKAMFAVPYDINPISDHTNGKLEEALKFAESRNDLSLRNCLDGLKKVAANCEYRTVIMADRCDWSFYFTRYRKDEESSFAGNGGIIFHDNGKTNGDRNHITMESSFGWNTHT